MTVQTVAEWVGGSVEGDATLALRGLAALDQAGPADLTFADARHAAGLGASKAAAAIVAADAPACDGKTLIRVASMDDALYALLGRLAAEPDLPPPGVHPSAVVAPDAKLGAGAALGPGVVIAAGVIVGERTVLCANVSLGRGVQIGPDSILHEGVVVKHGCRIGRRCRVGPNSVIGYDGFGFRTVRGVHRRWPHTGIVVLEDDVELDACTCVDRAKIGETRIGAGARVDNLVQIAHNCRIGPGAILAGQVGIAGSAKLGKYVVLGGHAGVGDHVNLADGVQLGARAVALHDIDVAGPYTGMYALPVTESIRIHLSMRKLPDLLKRVAQLEKRLAALESPENH